MKVKRILGALTVLMVIALLAGPVPSWAEDYQSAWGEPLSDANLQGMTAMGSGDWITLQINTSTGTNNIQSSQADGLTLIGPGTNTATLDPVKVEALKSVFSLFRWSR